MHPRIQEVVDYVDAQRTVLRRVFETVPPALRDVPPAPGQWSPGGIVEHLAIVRMGAKSRGVASNPSQGGSESRARAPDPGQD
jgi:hypothetical protein